MLKNKFFLFSFTLLCPILIITISSNKLYSQQEVIKEAVDFSLKDLDDNDVKLSDSLGTKPILLNFWTTWCPSCQAEIPHLKEFYKEYKDKVNVYAIDIQETKEKVSKVVEEKAIEYPMLLDVDGKVANSYKIYGIPTIVIIDTNKNIAYYGHDIKEAKNIVSNLIKK